MWASTVERANMRGRRRWVGAGDDGPGAGGGGGGGGGRWGDRTNTYRLVLPIMRVARFLKNVGGVDWLETLVALSGRDRGRSLHVIDWEIAG